MKTFLLTSAAALLLAGTAGAAEVKIIVDADADGIVTVEEFNTFRSNDTTFTTWDADGDAMISNDEYVAGFNPDVVLKIWDTDADGALAGDELTVRSIYTGWDADTDGRLTRDEWVAGVQSDDSFTVWDADGDGMLSADEFYNGNWSRFDVNADGNWDEVEWTVWQNSAFRAGREVSQ